MADPTRSHSIYTSVSPSRAHRYDISEVLNVDQPTTVPSDDIGVAIWNKNHGGYNYWDGGNWRYPNGADGWKDTP